MARATSVWPRVGYEPRPWSTAERGPASRRGLSRHRGPYQAAVVPQIAHARLESWRRSTRSPNGPDGGACHEAAVVKGVRVR
jgi:hypothetical protein